MDEKYGEENYDKGLGLNIIKLENGEIEILIREGGVCYGCSIYSST